MTKEMPLVETDSSPRVCNYEILGDPKNAPMKFRIGEPLCGISGDLDNAPVWRIKEVDLWAPPGHEIKWAGGNANFDKVWNDRAALEYV